MTRNILLGTLFTLGSAIALLVIFLTEKVDRIPSANAATAATQLERGAMDYEQYCATCHGLAGQGLANETGAPSLNNIVQRYMTPNAQGVVPFEQQYGIKQKYGTIRNYVEATLVAGIRGTPMPAWAQSSGGPLRMDQIENITSYVLSWNGQPPESAVAVAVTAAVAALPTPDPNATPAGRGQAVFAAKGCGGCHAVNEDKLVGPGLGGLFKPEGTKSYGTQLPNGNEINDETVYDWIIKGTAGFPDHIATQDGETYTAMPAIALTPEEYETLSVYLKALNRDGTLSEDAGEPAPAAEPGTLQPTAAPTSQPEGTQPPTAPGNDNAPGNENPAP